MIKQNKNINFLRFIFSLIIIIFHMYHNNLFKIYGKLPEYNLFSEYTNRAYVIVELFFIISGYYFYNTKFLEISFNGFVYKKIVRLWPLFAIATIIEVYPNYNFTTIMKLLFLQCNGFILEYRGINWFVSSLFWTLLFYFALIKTFDKKYCNFIIALLVYFSYVYLINNGFSRAVKGYIFSTGIVRGIAGVGLGYLFHEFCRSIEHKIYNVQGTIIYYIMSIAEILLLAFLIYSFSFHDIKYNNNFIFIIAFLPLFFSFLFRLGFLSRILENDISYTLGTYSYALYVFQQSSFFLSIKVLKYLDIKNFYLGSVLTLIIAVILAISVQFLVEYSINYIKQRKSDNVQDSFDLM